MSLREWFTGTDEEKASMARAQDLKGKKNLAGRRDKKTFSEGSALQSQFTRRRILGALGGAAILATGVAIGLPSQKKSMSSVASPHSPRANPEPTESMLADSDTPETDAQIKLPEFSIKKINYKPSVPEGLEMTPSHFQEISRTLFDYIENDFPQFQKDFDGADGSQAKSQLVATHIIKYFDHLLSLDLKILAHANSKSMRTLNERCSYTTQFLIGQGRYISVMNPDPERPYPQLLYGESRVEEQMDVEYNGKRVEFPIVEIDARIKNINRAWYDSNNKFLMYSPAQTALEAQMMVGTELNAEQLAEFVNALRISTLKHESTHAFARHVFPNGTAEKSLRSKHPVSLGKMRLPPASKDLRRTLMQGIEVSEMTAVGVEMTAFPQFLKLYLSKMLPQTRFPNQYQQAFIHFLTRLSTRQTVPLDLRLKVQAFLEEFPRGNPYVISEVIMDPSLPESELVECGKQLFATGWQMFEQIEHEQNGLPRQ